MLFYFILGILFISLGIPIIENLESILSAFSQYIVYYFAYKVYLLKEKFSPQEEEQKKDFKIGFQQTDAIGYEIKVPDQEED